MKRDAKSLAVLFLFGFLVGCGPSAGNESNKDEETVDTSYFFGARIIPGDGSPALEDMSFVVDKGKFVTIGKRSEVAPPKGAARVELTGRTVTPVFVNVHGQPGMNSGAEYGPKNYTRDSMTADLSRYAYYGVMAVLTGGTDSGDLASSVRSELRDGKIKGARLLTAGRGIAARGGGPSALSGVPIASGNAAEARKAVAELASQNVDAVKLWMDDGFGKGAKLSSDAYRAAIEEAHKRNLKVVAQVFSLADAKGLVDAGVDGLVSSIRDREVDDELIAAMKAKNVFLAPALTSVEARFVYADRPDWLGEQTMREVYPAQLAGYLLDQVSINRFRRNPELDALRQQYAMAMKNLKRLSDGGVKIALGTNSGSADTYPGYFELRELIAMGEAGMQPMDVIKAATSVPAEVLGIEDLGTIAVGKTGHFLAMPENPLEDISTIKDVGVLYLDGSLQERSALIQNIQINTQALVITAEDRKRDQQLQAEKARLDFEKTLPHYGGFLLGTAASVRYMSVPVPRGGKPSVQAGPPDRITISMRASAAQLRQFYVEALPKYSWRAAGSCWEREHPQTKRGQTLCLQASNNSAVIQITEK